jgi:hypothetical protein
MQQLDVSRSPRSDKGRTKFTTRDFLVLNWVGDQYAVRLDQIGILLGRAAERATHEADIVQPTTAQRVLRRWLKKGFVKSKLILAREPVWVYLSSKGLHELGLPFREYVPTAALASHYYWTNHIRLWVEKQYPGDAWVSERLLFRKHEGDAKQTVHIPDGEVHRIDMDGDVTVIAIEVELTVKSHQRLITTMNELATRYDGVWYFTNATTHKVVTRTITSLDKEVSDLFRVRNLTITR